MNSKIIKHSALCFFLLMLDLIRPLGYSLNVEFILLGIFFLGFNLKMTQAIIIAAICGTCKDSFSLNRFSQSSIEFLALCFLINYLSSIFIFNRRPAQVLIIKSFIVLFALFVHVVYLSLINRMFVPFFSLSFIFQSYLIWFIINFLLERYALNKIAVRSR